MSEDPQEPNLRWYENIKNGFHLLGDFSYNIKMNGGPSLIFAV